MKLLETVLIKLGIDKLPRLWTIFLYVSLSLFLLCTVVPLYYQLIFSWDQARDAYEAYAIWHNFDLKIIGPSTDFPGVYHGALWFYLLAIPYGITQGNTIITAYIFLLLHILTIFSVGKLAATLFNDKKITIVSITLYAAFPLVHAFTRWLSNPIITLFVMPFLLISLWKYINGGGWKQAGFVGLYLGLMTQSDIGFAMFYLLLPIYFAVFKKLPKLKDIAIFIVISFFTLSSYLLSELKFNFRASKEIIRFFLSHETGSFSPLDIIISTAQKYIDLIYFTLLPVPKIVVFGVIIVGIIGLFLLKHSKEQKRAIRFLLIWLLNIVLFKLFNTGLTNSAFIFAPSILIVAILGSFLLVKLSKKRLLFCTVLICILAFQTLKITDWLRADATPLSVQYGMTFYQQRKAVDYTYQQAQGEPFVISTVTNPLYINTVWAYHYEFYGKKRYKYVPYFDGKNQEGYLGNLPVKNNIHVKNYFLILEPTPGIPDDYFVQAQELLDKYTRMEETKNFGKFRVEKRKYFSQQNL